jgi:serine phosphatase RsbU (regulator of sigma subunit)
MSLRVRLIVAFFLFSVVPLAAVTFYSYASNLHALQIAAQHETEMLTGELTQRMQVVTGQISERVEHLMDVQAAATAGTTTATGTMGTTKIASPRTASSRPRPTVTAPAPAPAPTPTAPPAGTPTPPAAPAPMDPTTMEGQVAASLGDVAMLLNNVEMRGLGRGAERGRAGSPPPDRQPTTVVTRDEMDPSQIKIDLAPIRRDLFRQLAPGGSFDQMTPDERARVGREVNQRLLGIVQGVHLSAAEVQKKADAAKQKAASTTAPSSPGVTAPAAPRVYVPMPLPPGVRGRRPLPSRTVVSPVPPPAPSALPGTLPDVPPIPTPPAPKPMTRKAALTGTRLNVSMESNGKVVRQVNAEINLPNLLATVFANTRRDSGEIPFAIGKDGHLYAPADADRTKLASLDVAHVNGTPGTERIDNWIVVTQPDRSGAGLRFGIARPVGNLLNDLRRTTARNAGFGLLFIAVALVGMVPLSGRLTRNLTSLTDGVDRIAHGDYAARVPVKSGDEVGRLAAAFNRMAADVERHQHDAVEQERIRRELELGRRIQSDMLPHAPLHFGLTEVKGVSVPAREVGGDFFNYFALDSGLVALLVGDVSGKGVGAALLMANIQASLRTRFALGQGLSAIAEAIDLDIEANSPGPVYATLFIAIFDPATRRMRYVNAGHNPQFVLRGDGRLEKMSSTGLPVGMLAGHGYKELAVQLAPGDLLFFYTDGCVEMENERDEMFGSERLEALVAASTQRSADEVLATVESAIATFRGGRDLFDDATMMAVRVG